MTILLTVLLAPDVAYRWINGNFGYKVRVE